MSSSSWSTASSVSTDDPEPNVASLCPRPKYIYEKCFQAWYTNEYLTGQSSQLPCEAEYVHYQQCLLTKLNDDVKSQLPAIDVRNPGSLDGGAQGKSKAATSNSAQQKPAASNSAAS